MKTLETSVEIRNGPMTLIHNAVTIIKRHGKAFIAIDAAYFELSVIIMIVTPFFPSLKEQSIQEGIDQFSHRGSPSS